MSFAFCYYFHCFISLPDLSVVIQAKFICPWWKFHKTFHVQHIIIAIWERRQSSRITMEGNGMENTDYVRSRVAPRCSRRTRQTLNINTKWKENNLSGVAMKAGDSLWRKSISQTVLKWIQIRTCISVCVPAYKRVRDRWQLTAIKAATSAIDAIFNPSD